MAEPRVLIVDDHPVFRGMRRRDSAGRAGPGPVFPELSGRPAPRSDHAGAVGTGCSPITRSAPDQGEVAAAPGTSSTLTQPGCRVSNAL